MKTYGLIFALSIAACLIGGQTIRLTAAEGETKTWAERLGWPAGKRVVIFHADDVGMCYEANLAVQEALTRGDYRSAAAMVPCPWFNEMAGWCIAHPGYDVGLHLTLTSEWKVYRWGPVA